MWSPAYCEFVERHGLIGAEVEIPEAVDLSGIGASIEILDQAGATAEANEAYPGLVVKADGFVPVGGCMLGSGDQYFINLRDKQPGSLYRIDHELVLDEEYDRERAIERVLESYEELLRYVVA